MSERKSQWEQFLEEEENPAPIERQCPRCKKYKLLSEYSKGSDTKYGTQSRCKQCVREYKKKYRKFRSKEDRFWKTFNACVDKTQSGCLLWTGRLGGRSKLPVYGKNSVSVRRVVYRLTSGDLPDDMFVLVTCGNRLCVNHLHFKLGTETDCKVLRANRAPTGARNGKYTKPERTPRGDRSGARKHPERMPRGVRNGACLHPERLPRGERHGNAKLTESLVRVIRRLHAKGIGCRKLAKEFGVDKDTIQCVVRRETWAHVE